MHRQIFLTLVTTGLKIEDGNRIIEIGCVEMIDRKLTGNNYHQYIQSDRECEGEEGTFDDPWHGITTEFLADKPRFEDIAEGFLNYIRGAKLIIHNAAYDIGYLNHELTMANATVTTVSSVSEVIDSLGLARQLYPGQINTVVELCERYDINNMHRKSNGAILDSEILADLYQAMTSGQKTSLLRNDTRKEPENNTPVAPWETWDRWSDSGAMLEHLFTPQQIGALAQYSEQTRDEIIMYRIYYPLELINDLKTHGKQPPPEPNVTSKDIIIFLCDHWPMIVLIIIGLSAGATTLGKWG